MDSSSTISRRDFLIASAAAGIGLSGGPVSGVPEAVPHAPTRAPLPADLRLIDVNVTLSRWPARQLPLDETPKLVEKLRSQGVRQAWAGSFDGLLHKDVAGVNARLAADCRERGGGILIPFGTVNPKLPDWEDDLRRCAEVHQMPGIRLHPNYHGYKLDDPDFVKLLQLAAARKLIVQIALQMEDERMMHPLMRVTPVDIAPLSGVIEKTPGARIVLLNALNLPLAGLLNRVLASGEVCVEISFLEGVGGIGKFLEQAPASRVLFGSHSPLFYFESAVLKLRESEIEGDRLKGICELTARRLMEG